MLMRINNIARHDEDYWIRMNLCPVEQMELQVRCAWSVLDI